MADSKIMKISGIYCSNENLDMILSSTCLIVKNYYIYALISNFYAYNLLNEGKVN